MVLGTVALVSVAAGSHELRANWLSQLRATCAVLASAMAAAPGGTHRVQWRIIETAVAREFPEHAYSLSLDAFEERRAWWGRRDSPAALPSMEDSVARCFDLYADVLTLDEFLRLGDEVAPR